MWGGRSSGGAAVTPLRSCWFHELATKTCFYQTAGEEPEQHRERKQRKELTEGEAMDHHPPHPPPRNQHKCSCTIYFVHKMTP